jgi:DNA-binding FrmR family transcriptional regulator
MPNISAIDESARQELLTRLRRIEGQARGIQKMIEDGRDCELIMNQVSSMGSAAQGLNGRLLELYALYCMSHPDEFGSPEQAVSRMVGRVLRVVR